MEVTTKYLSATTRTLFALMPQHFGRFKRGEEGNNKAQGAGQIVG